MIAIRFRQIALLLLAMSLVFIMIIHLIGHKGAAKRG